MEMARARVLCVDDEPNVLEGLALHLKRRFEVETARNGARGLEIAAQHGPFEVVVSDMRMPEMDGAVFLARMLELAPDTVRILLTGQADLDSAIAAINDGQIFRFLNKPCPAPRLIAAVQAAVNQHRLITAERVLLEQTLRGSINALVDVLALANPQAFGRATRVKQHVLELAQRVGAAETWPLEVAAVLSQLGCVTLPPETAERYYHGRELSQAERAMVERLPVVAEQLVAGIPRLDVVRAILARYAQQRPSAAAASGHELVATGAEALRIAVDLDLLESGGQARSAAIEVLRQRIGCYEPLLLVALSGLSAAPDSQEMVRDVSLAELRVGMVLAGDVFLDDGTLLVARGYTVTKHFFQRIANSRQGSVREPVRVVVDPVASAA